MLLRSGLVTGLFLSIGLMASAQGKKNEPFNQHKQHMEQTQQNKEIARRLYEEVLNKRNTALLPDLVAADYPGVQGGKGPDAFINPLLPLIKAFPDIQWKVQEVMAEGDKVVICWKLEGTQAAPYLNIGNTGRSVSNNGMAILTFREGKVASAMVQTDRLGFLQELGILPQDPAALSAPRPGKDEVAFIDKFSFPEQAEAELVERMTYNRNFIRTLPGFIRDEIYKTKGTNGQLLYITVAHWENAAAVAKAKDAVAAEYKRIGFNPAAFYERLHIQMERGTYHRAAN